MLPQGGSDRVRDTGTMERPQVLAGQPTQLPDDGGGVWLRGTLATNIDGVDRAPAPAGATALRAMGPDNGVAIGGTSPNWLGMLAAKRGLPSVCGPKDHACDAAQPPPGAPGINSSPELGESAERGGECEGEWEHTRRASAGPQERSRGPGAGRPPPPGAEAQRLLVPEAALSTRHAGGVAPRLRGRRTAAPCGTVAAGTGAAGGGGDGACNSSRGVRAGPREVAGWPWCGGDLLLSALLAAPTTTGEDREVARKPTLGPGDLFALGGEVAGMQCFSGRDGTTSIRTSAARRTGGDVVPRLRLACEPQLLLALVVSLERTSCEARRRTPVVPQFAGALVALQPPTGTAALPAALEHAEEAALDTSPLGEAWPAGAAMP